MNTIHQEIKAEAKRLGFSFLHVTRPNQPPHYDDYLRWLHDQHAGEMGYLTSARTQQARGDPAGLLEKSRSILTFGVRYSPLTRTLTGSQDSERPYGLIASYALHNDYHDTLKQAAHQLMAFIQQRTGRNVQYRIFVDSSALLEKDTAFMAGAGWIGKNSLLITPGSGSFQVLGCILTDLDLEAEASYTRDLCGACQSCRQSCPTGCITDNRNLRADECIAYLTIEYKGVLPRRLRAKMGNWVFGCDLCQNACPWNAPARLDALQTSSMPLWEENPRVDLLDEIRLDKETFQRKYHASPVLRATHNGYQRNLIVAMGNSGSPVCLPVLRQILAENPSSLLRAHAAWALSALHAPDLHILLEQALSQEEDECVREEIALCLANEI